MKGVTNIWFDQWKKNCAKGAPLVSWDIFRRPYWRCFFPQELKTTFYLEAFLFLDYGFLILK